MAMREENHEIPLSGLSYLHLLGELGHIYLSANLITKTLGGLGESNAHVYKISSKCVIKPEIEAIDVSI